MTVLDWVLDYIDKSSSHYSALAILDTPPGHSIIPRLLFPVGALLAAILPGFRPGGSRTSLAFEAANAKAADTLRALRRDSAASLTFASAGSGAIALEEGQQGNLFVHYTSDRGSVSIAGGWLGAGRRQYIWLPLRPSLAWIAPPTAATVVLLSADEIESLAGDIHAGLDALHERHALEQFLTPSAIPEAERRNTFDSYTSFMRAHGWQVSFNDNCTQRTLRRTDVSISPQKWPIADREVLARLEALVSEALKGVRPSSRILHQSR